MTMGSVEPSLRPPQELVYVAARRETGGPQALEVTAGIEFHPFGGRWAITVHNQD